MPIDYNEYGDWSEPDYGNWDDPPFDSRAEFWDAVGNDYILDNYMSSLMEPGLSDEQRQEIFDSMAEYLDWEYDLDLNDIWDWEDFREWYGTQ